MGKGGLREGRANVYFSPSLHGEILESMKSLSVCKLLAECNIHKFCKTITNLPTYRVIFRNWTVTWCGEMT